MYLLKGCDPKSMIFIVKTGIDRQVRQFYRIGDFFTLQNFASTLY